MITTHEAMGELGAAEEELNKVLAEAPQVK